MKRFLLSAAAGLMMAGTLSFPAVAQQGYGSQPRQGQGGYQSRPDDRGQPQGYQVPYQYQRQDDRSYGDSRNNDRDWNGNGNRRDDRNYNNGRGQRQASKYHDNQTKWRDNRRNARWNDRDHNGYYIGRDWHRGQPSARDYGRRGFALGYQPWQRGDRLGSYNQRYSEVDYRDYRVQRPQQGYRWVEDDNSGDLILAAIVGGLIVAVISNN